MKHATEGILKTFFDGEMDTAEREWVEKHISICPQCEKKAAEIRSRGESIKTYLLSLQSEIPPVTGVESREKLKQHLTQADNRLLTPLSLPRYRPVWIVVTLILVLGFLMTLAPVRAFANDFLALFRIQKIEFVEFNPLNLPNSEDSLRTAAIEVERLLNDEVVMTLHGEPQTVTSDAAEAITSFNVRFPDMQNLTSRITVQPEFDMVLTLDMTEIRTLFTAIGYSNVDLPDTLNGAEIQAAFAHSVVTALGQCAAAVSGTPATEDCTVFIQTPSPKVTAPPELDLQQLGQLYLQMLGMKSTQAARFSRNIDWTTTLVVPIPSTEASYKDVIVDGVPGTLIEGRRHNELVLMWVRNDIVYALVGKGEADGLLELANSIE